jgi:hypothetical protein
VPVPVKLRTPKGRRPFGDEVITLFKRLAGMPPSARKGPEWKEQSQRLAELLGLENEWWAMNHVEDEPSGFPPAEDNTFQHAAYWRVAEAREQLLQAIVERARIH